MASTLTKYYFAGGMVEVQDDGTTTTTRVYYSIGGQRVAMEEDDGTTQNVYYFVNDHLSSASVVTDTSGVLLSEQRYAPFGEVRTDVGTTITQTDFGYTGQRDMGDIGLMDYNARFYSPALGRFIQPDSIVQSLGNPQSFNRFSYVGNNPINRIDPSGHSYCTAEGVCAEDSDVVRLENDIAKGNMANIRNLLRKYGVYLTDSLDDRRRIAIARGTVYGAEILQNRLGHIIGSTNPREAWIAQYHSDKTPIYWLGENTSSQFTYTASGYITDSEGNTIPNTCEISSGGCTVGISYLTGDGTQVMLIKLLTTYADPQSAVNNVYHEYAHLLFNVILGRVPTNQIPDNYVRDRALILRPDDTVVWQQNETKSGSETLADFFVAWAGNAWRTDTSEPKINALAAEAATWMWINMSDWIQTVP